MPGQNIPLFIALIIVWVPVVADYFLDKDDDY